MTKEELNRLIEYVEMQWHYGGGHQKIGETLGKIQSEFERYIDVLEPLKEELHNCNCSPRMTATNYWNAAMRILTSHSRHDCDAARDMLERACDLIDTKEKPVCSNCGREHWECPVCKTLLKCPHCGKEVR